MRPALNVISALSGLALVAGGTAVLVYAQSRAKPPSESLVKRQITKQAVAHHNQAHGAPWAQGPIPTSASTVPPAQTADPQLVQGMPYPGALDLTYNLSPIAYTDLVNWQVFSGDVITSSTTGAIIVAHDQANGNPQITEHTVPNSGMITITGFSGPAIQLKGGLGGTGTYDLSTETVTWNQ